MRSFNKRLSKLEAEHRRRGEDEIEVSNLEAQDLKWIWEALQGGKKELAQLPEEDQLKLISLLNRG